MSRRRRKGEDAELREIKVDRYYIVDESDLLNIKGLNRSFGSIEDAKAFKRKYLKKKTHIKYYLGSYIIENRIKCYRNSKLPNIYVKYDYPADCITPHQKHLYRRRQKFQAKKRLLKTANTNKNGK
jgi:hypothetical protein